MKTPLIAILFTAAALTSQTNNAAGFQEISVPDAGSSDLTVGVWYPSDTRAPDNPNTEFGMALSIDGPVINPNRALVVISHGYSGWYAGHADTAVALADAGYIVAAPSHTGNTWSDMSSTTSQWLLDRPRHISRVIDHLLHSDSFAQHLTPSRIGIYGFSAGGYTALSLIGGIPDLPHAQSHCKEHPTEYVCAEGLMDAMIDSQMDELPDDAWGADERIQAAVIAAPGWGFAYTNSSLANVTADVQLWSGQLDVSVPTKTNAAWLATQLPATPETYWIEKANHFAFMVIPCQRQGFKESDPAEYKLVCQDAAGFDRLAFHDSMHQEMIRFFDTTLEVAN